MISVMMPVFNASPFLRKAIESILSQTEKEFELLIINDGSTDNSEDIILSYDDKRIRYYKKENGGEASARNIALEHATGEYIVFQDADDVALPNRLELLKQGFTSKNIGFVHSDMLLIDEMDSPIGYWQSKQLPKELALRFFLKIGTPFNNASMMIRKSIIERLRYDTELKVGTDTNFVSKFVTHYDSTHINLPLVMYRRHSNSLSRKSDYSVLYKHMQKFLQEYSLEELIPEVDWKQESRIEEEVRARAIIALFLIRRGMDEDGQRQFNELFIELGTNVEIGVDTTRFVVALGQLMMGTPQQALQLLMDISVKDHIVCNYIGEVYAKEKMFTEAKEWFLKAIAMKSSYIEPIENLKAIGAAVGYNLIDNLWTKFR